VLGIKRASTRLWCSKSSRTAQRLADAASARPDDGESDRHETELAEGYEHHRRLSPRITATPLFAASAPIYNAAMAMGLGKKTPAQCAAVLEQMAGRPPAEKKARAALRQPVPAVVSA